MYVTLMSTGFGDGYGFGNGNGDGFGFGYGDGNGYGDGRGQPRLNPPPTTGFTLATAVIQAALSGRVESCT